MDEGVIERYRWIIDRHISEVLQNADEIMIAGYSMPPYDFDFKSLLIKGLMANKNRSCVTVSLITKGDELSLNELQQRFKHLAGKVEVIGRKGFYDYIKESLDRN